VENLLDRHSEDPARRRIVFDLKELDFLDLAGLRTILRAKDRGRELGFDVVVVRPRGLANRVFTLTRAGQELSMVSDPEAA
jgi:anti-anti-sigma factor